MGRKWSRVMEGGGREWSDEELGGEGGSGVA